MAKKKPKAPKNGPLVVDARTVWQVKKPRYNGYTCGHGPHGSAKYNRAKVKSAWRRENEQGAPSRGSFPFCRPLCAHLALNYRLAPMRDASVAQGIEHRSPKAGVVRSNRIGGTNGSEPRIFVRGFVLAGQTCCVFFSLL